MSEETKEKVIGRIGEEKPSKKTRLEILKEQQAAVAAKINLIQQKEKKKAEQEADNARRDIYLILCEMLLDNVVTKPQIMSYSKKLFKQEFRHERLEKILNSVIENHKQKEQKKADKPPQNIINEEQK